MRLELTAGRSAARPSAGAAAAFGAAALVLAGCQRGDWEAVSYEIGDTVVVRTASGSVWGEPARLVEEARIEADPDTPQYDLREITALALGPDSQIYVADGRMRRVHVYREDGAHSSTIGAGTLALPNGVAVLPDGRIVVRDVAAARLNVYTARGNPLGTWPSPHPRGLRVSGPIFLDAEGRLYNRVFLDGEAAPRDRRYAFLRYSADGSIEDTIPDPVIDWRPLTLPVEEPDGRVTRLLVPFSPRAYWTRSRLGDVVIGISDRYSLDVIRPDGGVVRIERDVAPVAVSAQERAANYQRVDRRGRSLNYRWTWRGPPIPDTKPFFKRLSADRDGRIWVQLHQPAEQVALRRDQREDDASEGVRAATEGEQMRWEERLVFDVFEPDGTYLGQVSAPPGFRTSPEPVIQGNTVWAVVRTGEDSPSVVRFRIER